MDIVEEISKLWQRVAGRPELKFVVLLIAAYICLRVVRWSLSKARRKKPRSEASSLDLSVAKLWLSAGGDQGALRVRNVRVRVALAIVAPLGKDSKMPTEAEVPELVDKAVSGLGDVLRNDRTVCRVWPMQLSENGFRHALHRHVELPDEETSGQQSRWCFVAGRIVPESDRLMMGLIACSGSRNSIGPVSVQTEHDWYDVLRVDD